MSKGKGPRNRLRGPELKKYGESPLWEKGIVKIGNNITMSVKTEAGEPFDLSGCEITTHVKEVEK